MARRKISDPAHEETERMIAEIEKKVKREYQQAAKEIQEKLDDYFRRFQVKDEIHRREVYDGEMSEADYLQWRTNQMLVGDRWKEMRDNLALDLHNSNRIARSIVSGYMPDAYAANFNYGTFQVEKLAQADTSFTLYDRNTVERILRDDPQILQPPGKRMLATFAQFDAYKRGEDVTLHPATKAAFDKLIASNKDIRWQEGKLQSVTLQAVLQGESIPNMAKRIANTMGELNRNATVRYARTAMTEAQNAGRVNSYKRCQDMGIGVKQQWMSTHDSRTRDSHVLLDGEIQEVGKKFSNGCKYPGDPAGRPEEIWNCRCTLLPVLTKYNFSTDISYDGKIDGMTYDEWKESRKKKKELKQEKHKVAEGKDISTTWTRRPDKFAFEIEDVINAQGFDGLPQVVSEKEFEKAVSESNFVAQRTYSAPSKEALEKYREQLYKGDFYVECSGGARLGEGMYCVANFEGKITKPMTEEIGKYQKALSYIETFTMVKGAKIVNYHDIYEEKNNYAMQFSGAERRKYMKMDVGSFAALKGYDAITENPSNGIAYTVILNRTKCIFKGE